MPPYIISSIMCFLAILGYAYMLYFKKPKGTTEKEGDKYSDLKASVMLLYGAFPMLLFILTAFGFSSYDVVIEKVTARVSKKAEREKVEAMVNQIEEFHKQARQSSESISSMDKDLRDTILNIANESFVKLLPKGTIIPYSGKRSAIDTRYWAICDGSRGTPDLTKRFILGSTFKDYKERTGGQKMHSHIVKFELTNSEIVEPGGDAGGRAKLTEDEKIVSFKADFHEHSIEKTLLTEEVEYWPPYYRLVFLMKIQ